MYETASGSIPSSLELLGALLSTSVNNAAENAGVLVSLPSLGFLQEGPGMKRTSHWRLNFQSFKEIALSSDLLPITQFPRSVVQFSSPCPLVNLLLIPQCPFFF